MAAAKRTNKGGRFDTCPAVRMGAWQSVRDRFGARQRDTHSKPY